MLSIFTMRFTKFAVLSLAAGLVAGPGAAVAASGEGHGAAVGRILFTLGLLLLAANLGGVAAVRLGQPSVLGDLLIGVVLMVLVTTVVAPAGPRWAFGRSSRDGTPG